MYGPPDCYQLYFIALSFWFSTLFIPLFIIDSFLFLAILFLISKGVNPKGELVVISIGIIF